MRKTIYEGLYWDCYTYVRQGLYYLLITRKINKKAMNSDEIMMRRERLGDFYAWIVSASMLIYGSSLAMSSAISPQQMADYYHVDFSLNLMISIYNGCFAMGGMMGSYFIEQFNTITTKRRSFLICTTIIIFSSATSTIPSIGALFVSRFLLGLGCGFSMIVGGIYIRQTFSQRKRVSLGGVYSLSKMIGSEITLFISYLLVKGQVSNIHLYVDLGCGCLAFSQMLLVIFVLPELPMEMMMTKQEDEMNAALSEMYHAEDIPHRIKQMQIFQKELQVPLDTNNQSTMRRIISAIHCGFLRQFCGIPYIVAYSAQILLNAKFPEGSFTTLFTCSWRMMAGIVGIWVISALNRSKLIIFTTIFGALFCFIISIFNALQLTFLTLASLVIYILPLASCLEIITWYYPFECTRPVYGKYAAFFSWFGMGCLIIIPPYISQAMPNGESYPTFIFFGVYLCFSVIMNYKFLVDVDDKKVVDESESNPSANSIGTGKSGEPKAETI